MDRRASLLCLALIVAVLLSPNVRAALEPSAMCLNGAVTPQPLSAAPVEGPGPGVIWKADLGRMIDGVVIGSDGHSYTSRRVDLNDLNEHILDARDPQGKLVWSKSFRAEFITGPTISSDGAIWLVMKKTEGQPAVTVLRLDGGGEVIWESAHPLNAGTWYSATAPVIDVNGTAHFALRETWLTATYSSRSNYSFYQVSSSGDVQRTGSFVHGDVAGYTTIVGDGTMYALNLGNEVCALDLDGNVRWNRTMGGSTAYDLADMSVATASDGTVLLSTKYSLTAIDPDGQQLWESLLGGYAGPGMAIDENGTVYVHVRDSTFSPERAGLCAVGANGTRLWKIEIGNEQATGPIIDGDRAMIFGSDHFIYSIGLDGDLLWSYDAGGMVDSVMMDGRGRLFFTYYDASSQSSFLVACQGVPKITWVDWIARNPLLVVASAAVVLTSLLIVAKIWKRRRSN